MRGEGTRKHGHAHDAPSGHTASVTILEIHTPSSTWPIGSAHVLQAKLPIINKLGLHARAAAKFVSVTGGFGATIRVRFNGRAADGKSIMGVMMLGARQGTEIEVDVEGEDEAALLEALTALLANRFGEEA